MPGSVEEYDGVNGDEAKAFILVIALPLLVRGHAVMTRVLEDIISVRVPNIYRLQLGLSHAIDEKRSASFFDCKLRKLFLTLPVRQQEAPEPAAATAEVQIE